MKKKTNISKKKNTREFATGANRNTDQGKFDYEAFINPAVENSYARYMHKHRKMEDGTLRDGDNWQKGIPMSELMKSMLRHVYDVHLIHRGYNVFDESGKLVLMEDCLNGVKFNVNAYILAMLKGAVKIKRGE